MEALEGSRIRCGFYSKPRLPPHIRGREVWITPLPLRNAPFQIDESWLWSGWPWQVSATTGGGPGKGNPRGDGEPRRQRDQVSPYSPSPYFQPSSWPQRTTDIRKDGLRELGKDILHLRHLELRKVLTKLSSEGCIPLLKWRHLRLRKKTFQDEYGPDK